MNTEVEKKGPLTYYRWCGTHTAAWGLTRGCLLCLSGARDDYHVGQG
jgi:hypothetical protein